MCDCFLFSTFTLFSVIPFYFLYFPIFVRPIDRGALGENTRVSSSWYFLFLIFPSMRWYWLDSPDRTELLSLCFSCCKVCSFLPRDDRNVEQLASVEVILISCQVTGQLDQRHSQTWEFPSRWSVLGKVILLTFYTFYVIQSYTYLNIYI